MSLSYFEATIPTPYRILGLQLKPFCLGHFLLLSRFECAFASEETTIATREDLILAVLICSQSYEDFLKFIEQENYLDEVRKWGEQVGKYNLEEKVSLFNEYMQRANTIPPIWEQQEGQPSGAHWTQAVKLTLTGELGYTETEALNAPLAKTLADYFKHAENVGAVRFKTAAEISFIEENKEEAACPL